VHFPSKDALQTLHATNSTGPMESAKWVLRLQSKEEFESAMEKYIQAIDTLDDAGVENMSTVLVRSTCQLKLAQCLNVLGMHDDCISTCTDLLNTIPDTMTEYIAAAACIRGAAYYTKGGSMDHAMADLQKADELCPHDATVKAVYDKLPKLLRVHGDRLMSVGKYAMAMDKYQRAAAGLAPSETSTDMVLNLREYCLMKKAECEYNLGCHDACIDTCTEVLNAMGPHSNDNYQAAVAYIRGVEYHAKGDLEMAFEDLKEAHELSPHHATIKEAYEELLEKMEAQKRSSLERSEEEEAEEEEEHDNQDRDLDVLGKRAAEEEEQEEEGQGGELARDIPDTDGHAAKGEEKKEPLKAARPVQQKDNAQTAAKPGVLQWLFPTRPAAQNAPTHPSAPADQAQPEATAGDAPKKKSRKHKKATEDQRAAEAEAKARAENGGKSGGKGARTTHPSVRAARRLLREVDGTDLSAPGDPATDGSSSESESESLSAPRNLAAGSVGETLKPKSGGKGMPVAILKASSAPFPGEDHRMVSHQAASTVPKLRSRPTSWRDVGDTALDAIQSLQKKCSEPLPPQCVNHIDKYLTASLQGVDTLKLEVSVKCMSAIHNKVTKLCKQAKESLRKQGLPAPAFVVKGETTEAGVDFLLVDPFDVELEDNGHSAYLAAVSYALEHLSDEGVGVFIVTPDDLQEQVSLTHTLARALKEADFHVHRCPMRWARSNPHWVEGMKEPAEVEYPMVIFSRKEEHNYFPSMQVAGKRFSNVLWIPMNVDDLITVKDTDIPIRPSTQKPVTLMRELLRL